MPRFGMERCSSFIYIIISSGHSWQSGWYNMADVTWVQKFESKAEQKLSYSSNFSFTTVFDKRPLLWRLNHKVSFVSYWNHCENSIVWNLIYGYVVRQKQIGT